MVLMINKV
jgi:hypothetical protein